MLCFALSSDSHRTACALLFCVFLLPRLVSSLRDSSSMGSGICRIRIQSNRATRRRRLLLSTAYEKRQVRRRRRRPFVRRAAAQSASAVFLSRVDKGIARGHVERRVGGGAHDTFDGLSARLSLFSAPFGSLPIDFAPLRAFLQRFMFSQRRCTASFDRFALSQWLAVSARCTAPTEKPQCQKCCTSRLDRTCSRTISEQRRFVPIATALLI